MVYVSLLYVLTIWQLTKRTSCVDTMVTTETSPLETNVTISVHSESNTTENLSARTASKFRHRMVSLTRGYLKPRKGKKPDRIQNPRGQIRLLEPPDTCLIWSPSLNLTADVNLRQLIVDYCHSERPPAPNTYTCVTNTEITMCLVVESPRCGHVFENLTTGNYTIRVQPLCKSCFDVEVYNTDCITPIYTKNIHLEEMTEDKSLVQKTQSYSTHTEVIVPASCAGAILVFIFVVIYVMAKCRNCTERFSCGRRDTITMKSLPSVTSRPAADDQTNVEMSQHVENSRETEAMLSNCGEVLQKQASTDSEEQSYSCSYPDTNPLNMARNGGQAMFINNPSCETINTSSVETCDMLATDQESQRAENNHHETLQSYFDTDTGINSMSARLLYVPRTMDIPYHLVFTDI